MNEKLDLLKINGVINNETYKSTVIIANELLELDFINSVDEIESLVIHLAMAIERLSNNEKVSKLNAVIVDEIKENECFYDIEKLWNRLEKKIPTIISSDERQYIYLHLCSIYSNKEGR